MRYIMNNFKTCSFFGHRDCKLSSDDIIRLRDTIEKLIIKHNVKEFLFGRESNFDRLSFNICLDIKMDFPEISLVYVRAKNEYPNKDFVDKILELYDDTYFPKSVHNAGKYCYIKRNIDMIDNSDYCIFYYLDRDYSFSKDFFTHKQTKTKSGTKIALEYAKKKSKEIIIFN